MQDGSEHRLLLFGSKVEGKSNLKAFDMRRPSLKLNGASSNTKQHLAVGARKDWFAEIGKEARVADVVGCAKECAVCGDKLYRQRKFKTRSSIGEGMHQAVWTSRPLYVVTHDAPLQLLRQIITTLVAFWVNLLLFAPGDHLSWPKRRRPLSFSPEEHSCNLRRQFAILKTLRQSPSKAKPK